MRWVAPLALLFGAYACGASDQSGVGGGTGGGNTCSMNSACQSGTCINGVCATEPGDACESNAQCASGSCVNGLCTGGGGHACTNNDQCSSGSCVNGTCAGGHNDSCTQDSDCVSGSCVSGRCEGGGAGGSGGTAGSNDDGGSQGTPCTTNSQCASGICENGFCTGTSAGGTSSGGSGGGFGGIGGTPGPHFPGTGSGFRPLTPGCGPDTADDCTGSCEQSGGEPSQVVRPPATLCFSGDGDATPQDPAVVIEQVIEVINGVEYVHIRITFDPSFTDNSYGEGSCCGWSHNRGHNFGDLTGSDHTEVLLTDANGNTIMHFKIDLITADPNSPCGYGTLGVTGGDGAVLEGDASNIVAVATSLDRNLNGCGYCTSTACSPSGDCTVDSPTTDENYTPNPGTPDWDYRQVYEMWILASAFGTSGFGQAYITYVHSSPAKSRDTITVTPTPCPPEWDTPYCPPSVIAEGGNCGPGTGGSGGMDGGGGSGGSGGDGGTTCPPNYQVYVTTEGAQVCTPIPFAGYPDRAPCPAGYVLDIASEGQFCLPASG